MSMLRSCVSAAVAAGLFALAPAIATAAPRSGRRQGLPRLSRRRQRTNGEHRHADGHSGRRQRGLRTAGCRLSAMPSCSPALRLASSVSSVPRRPTPASCLSELFQRRPGLPVALHFGSPSFGGRVAAGLGQRARRNILGGRRQSPERARIGCRRLRLFDPGPAGLLIDVELVSGLRLRTRIERVLGAGGGACRRERRDGASRESQALCCAKHGADFPHPCVRYGRQRAVAERRSDVAPALACQSALSRVSSAKFACQQKTS